MNRTTLALLVVLVLSSALLGFGTLTRGQTWGDDFAAYLMQAKSLLSGEMAEFVAHNTFTVTQSSHQIGPAAYPWGFPLMLAPVYALTGLSPLALKLPGLLTFLGFLLALFYWIKRRFAVPESLLAVSLFAFQPILLLFLDNILSDIPFLFLSTLSLLLADLYCDETQDKRKPLWAGGLGATIFAAAFVRTQGWILLGSVLLWLGFRFLGKPASHTRIVRDAAALTAVFGALWGLSALLFPGGQESYLALYADFGPNTFPDNMVAYSQLFGLFFEGLPASRVVFSIFAFLFIWGAIVRFKTENLPLLYALLYLVVLWSWPEWQGFRFIFPMLPIFILFAWHGLDFLLCNLPPAWKRIIQMITRSTLTLITAIFLWNACANAIANLQENRAINGPFDPYSIEMFDFIKEKTPPDSVIVFFKPRALRLMTNRDAVAITECEHLTLGDYLALSKKVGENLQIPPEQIAACNLPLETVFQNRRFVVFRVAGHRP
ncbi:MAG: hypothetical protein Fur0043_22030 [Anaerolineales bacterium]